MVGDRQVKDTAAELARLFPDRRAEGKTNIRRCQLVMIRMLMILDRVCRSEGIAYWLTAGTLIGALRHRGFIPWDWDIDIGMTEEDYRALLAVKDRFPPDIFFQNRDSEPTYEDDVVVAKLRDRHSNYTNWQSRHPDVVWHNGLQLDILLYRQDAAGRLINPVRGTPYRRDELFPLRELEFEGAPLLVPKDPAFYIAVRYGDYMILPPASEREVREGHADPFNPCDHPESLAYPGTRPVGRRSWQAGAAAGLAARLGRLLLRR